MSKRNIVFVGKSLDGYIAGENGELDWLDMIPGTDQVEMGYTDLMHEVDALVMGRSTFEFVANYPGDWPYTKHVFVLSHSLEDVPDKLQGSVTLLKGKPQAILEQIHSQGYSNLYVDGGQVVQQFLNEDLIDELRITTIPILLGSGISLFGALQKPLEWEHVESKLFLNQIVQNCYRRKR